MVKFGFRFLSNKDALWVRILREKYKVVNGCPTTIKRANCSFLWGSLSKVWNKVHDSICWSIGNGKLTKFWLDVWIPSLGPLINHTVNDAIVDVDAYVSDFVDEGGNWNWAALQSTITHLATMQIASICPPSEEAGDDRCVWRWNSNGKCSVAEAYGYLCRDRWSTEDACWVSIWSYNGPQRVRQFIWLAFKDRLLTNVERCRRHITDDATCFSCGGAQESIDHVLRCCPDATSVWRKIVPKDIWLRFISIPFEAWLLENLNLSKEVDGYSWSTIFGLICWRLWKNRNDKVFRGELWSAESTIIQSRAWARAVFNATTSRIKAKVPMSKSVSWSPPSSGSWKLNTDGAVKGILQVASSGGVIRNDVGAWFKGYSRSLGHGSVIVAELWAIYDGLQLAWDNGIRSIEVESDNQAVVYMINSKKEDGSCFSLVRNIWGLCDRDWSVVVKHVYREVNSVADYLANWSSGQDIGFYLHEEPPIGVRNLLLSDRLGIEYVRNG